jgi:probable rRNA maturation factor
MIEFFCETDVVSLEELIKAEPVIRTILSDFGYKLSYLNVIIMTNEELLEINREFLKHDYYTDIITFNYATEVKDIEGELYISHQMASENAVDHDVTMINELFRVIIHGVLHLVGYKDDTKELKVAMQTAENKYLTQIVSRETIN